MKFLLRFIILVLSPIATVCGISTVTQWWDERQYPPTTQFVRSRWNSDWKYRYSVLPTVEKSIVRKGMTSAQVEALLGEPDIKQHSYWEYEMQPPGIDFARLMDFAGTLLDVEFDAKGKVSSVQKEDWTD